MTSLSLTQTIILLSSLAGLAALVLGWQLFGRWALLSSRTRQRILSAESARADGDLPGLPAHSLERRLREAGLSIRPLQFRLASLALGLLGALLAGGLFLPGLPALAIGGLLAWTPFAWLQEQTLSRGLRVDADLPLALSRIAAGLQANRGLEQVLQTTAASLPGQGPLARELARTARELRTGPFGPALRSLAERSPSASLGTLALLLESYLRAGGGQYAGVVSDAAVQIQRVISVRNHARAKAAQALDAARLIPLIMGGVLVLMSQDPATAASFRSLPAQLVIVFAMLVMLGGFLMMRAEIRRVV